jgi:hypothetical protein
MSLSAGNIYIYENKFRLDMKPIGETNLNTLILDCVMMVTAKPQKTGGMYKCQIVTGSYKLPHSNTYYRIPNYALPKETFKAKGKPPLTFQQGQQMTDLAIHIYNKDEGDLIIDHNDFGGVGFRKGRHLERAYDKSKAEKRRYKKIFQAEEAPGDDEEVDEEPDE